MVAIRSQPDEPSDDPPAPETGEADSRDVSPWALPLNWRPDGEPRRAALLRRLANLSFLFALASWYPCLFTCVACVVGDIYALLLLGPAALLGLLAVLLGVSTGLVAAADLARMARTLIDPNADSDTLFARRRAASGALVGLPSALLWGWLLVNNAL